MAAKVKTPPVAVVKRLTKYVVQRLVESADGPIPVWMTGEVWADIGVYDAHSGVEAMKKGAEAAREREGVVGPAAGRYRAFPFRSDNRLDVTVEVKSVASYSAPTVPQAASNGHRREE